MPSSWTRAVGLASAALLAASAARAAEPHRPGSVDLKPDQEIAFAAGIADGRVALGPARLVKPGAAPKDGEIVFGVVKHGLSPYADVTAIERTAEPIDFVATGLIGDIKIDEIVVCGRLDAPGTGRIASGSWRVSLSRFAVHPGGAAAAGEGDLGCPR